jgi:hypothetical protein
MKQAVRRVGGFGIVLLALAIPLKAAGGAAQLSPLVVLQGDEFLCSGITQGSIPFEPPFCSKGTSRERSVSVFRNGRVIDVATQQPFIFQGASTASSTAQDVTVSRAQVRSLSAFLDSQQIANRRGFCNPFSDVTGPLKDFSSAAYKIFWYAAHGRRTTITLDLQDPRPCPPEILAIFNAVVGFGSSGSAAAE